MAYTIENNYTGNNSTVLYSFTFPYLETTDIKVSLDAIDTSAYTLASATQVQFNTAPGTGVKIRIYRDTEIDNLRAEFFSGSAIRAQDLNEDFLQTLYSGQESEDAVAKKMSTTGTSVMTGNLQMGEDTSIVFEGATDDAHETTLTVTDPTADRTITLPNVTGTVVTTGDTATVTATMMAADSVDSSELVDGSIDTSHIANSAVTSAKIADGTIVTADLSTAAVATANIADGAVTTAKYGAASINTAAIGDGEVTAAKLATSSVTTDKLAGTSVTGAKIANDAIDSNHYAADSIDTEHYGPLSIDETAIGTGVVTTNKLADDAVSTAKIADGAVATATIADDGVTAAKIADNAVVTSCINAQAVTTTRIANGAVGVDQIGADAVTAAKIADNAIGTEHIADAELSTLAGMQSGTASVLADSTALAATTAEINSICENRAAESSITNDDAKIPTSGAVVDYVAAQIAPLGGLEVIADEDNFPAIPASGVVISIADVDGIVINGSGVCTTARTAGNGSDNVTINGFPTALRSKTLSGSLGLMVSSTGSSNTYNYHKLLGKEDDIEQLSQDISDFAARYRVHAGEPSSNNDEGDLVYDTNADKMKVYDSATSAWKEVTSTGDFKYLFLCPAGGTGAPTLNGSIATYDLREASNSGAAASVTNAAQLMVSINGIIQKPNTGTSAPAEGFALVDTNTIIFGANLASGDSVFIIQSGSAVTIPTPGDDTVSTAKIQSGAVTLAKMASESVDEDNLQISNAGSNGQYLQKQSGNTGGLTWSTVSTTPTTTRGDIIYRGASADQRLAKGTNGQYLKIGANDPEWADVIGAVAGGCIYENDQTISADHTIASGKGAHSVGPITVNATVTVNGNWVVS